MPFWAGYGLWLAMGFRQAMGCESMGCARYGFFASYGFSEPCGLASYGFRQAMGLGKLWVKLWV